MRDGLGSRSFVGLLTTQFLGALNDNAFRWFVVPMAMPVLGGEAKSLSLGLACFTLPYLVLASLAGYLADRFSKRSVIVSCKVAEIVIMSMGITAVCLGSVTFLFLVVALMGSQSALFGPSKFGSIPEILKSDKISSGNGWMGMITVVASAIGLAVGYALYTLCEPDLHYPTPFTDLWPATATLVGVALCGLIASLFIRRLPAADPNRIFAANPIPETYRNLRLLASNKALLRAALGIAFFWFLASLGQSNVTVFAQKELQLSEQIQVVPLLLILVAGLASGSLLAGLWSGGTVELGIVPLGALGIVGSACSLYLSGHSIDPADLATAQAAYYWSCWWLFTLGLSAGLFNIPLEAYLQYRSEVQTRGTILAASNFISFSFMLLSAGFLFVMNAQLGDSASEAIFLLVGLGTLPVFVYVVWLLPSATIRFAVWLASHTVYRVRVLGRENIPERGGALLVANHVSWIDGILLLISSARPIRMIAYADYVQGWGVRWLARTFGVIPIKSGGGPKALLRSMKTAKHAIKHGDLVCIFAEGQISRIGQLLPFQRGLMRIVEGTNAPVIPVYLDGLWGSIFSYHGGRVFWKRPRQWPYPVSILFGKPLRQPDNAIQVRQAVQDLGVEAMERRITEKSLLPHRFVRTCRHSLTQPKVSDSSGQQLTSGKLLAATLVFRRLLQRHVVDVNENMVGILLPPSVGGVLANTALSIMGRVPVNLNYTLSDQDLNYCVRECGITHVLTSNKVLERRPFDLDVEFVRVEDLLPKVTRLDKLLSGFQSYALPAFILERVLGLSKMSPNDLATVVFTSGSTGEPKGVMLSHRNICSNIDAADQLFQIKRTDVVLGVLPFFHSFGFTLTLWLPLTTDTKAVYHFNPADGRHVGKLCGKHGVTIIMATPTFLKNYLKRCEPEQMRKLDLAVVGAEKLPLDLAEAFKKKFGVSPTEGYGATELSPLATANVPDHRSTGVYQVGTKLGTVGRAVPGVSAMIVNPESWDTLGTDTEGLLLIKGPNVMQGYLNKPEKTDEVIRDGWYNTGDIAKIDADGFITITGRQSRFSKIGGEMVPHIRVEEELIRIVDDPEDDEADIPLAVTSVPDEKKGERLVVLHKPLKKPVRQILSDLAGAGLPNLWLPSADSFCEVEQIPLLGSGKLDLKGLNQLALEKFTAATAEK